MFKGLAYALSLGSYRGGPTFPAMNRRRWVALGFALGSLCFFICPFPGYANLVGDSADAVTFFLGSILFTAGGALQSWARSAGCDRLEPEALVPDQLFRCIR